MQKLTFRTTPARRMFVAGLALATLLALVPARPVSAAGMDSSETAMVPDTSDYARGMDAWEARDWDGVVTFMGKAVAAQPRSDMAWTRMGYAYRRLGLYDKSLAAYDTALSVNPANRGALEYLAEAHLQMGNVAQARAVALRLATECRKASPGVAAGKFPEGCEEMAVLKKNFAALGLSPES